EQIDSFLSGGGIALIVEVHQHNIKIVDLQSVQQGRGIVCGFDEVALSLEEQTQSFANVSLIVGNQNPRLGCLHLRGCRQLCYLHTVAFSTTLISLTIHPSLSWMMRLPKAALASEWVT